MTDQNQFSEKNQRAREQVHFTSGYQDQPIHFRDRKTENHAGIPSSAEGRPGTVDQTETVGRPGTVDRTENVDRSVSLDQPENVGRPGSVDQTEPVDQTETVGRTGSVEQSGARDQTAMYDSGYGSVRLSMNGGKEYMDGLSDEAKAQLMRMYEAAPIEARKPETDPGDFYRQGREVATLEDHFPLHDRIIMYYPSYQSMTLRQLRVYFTWRTVWRKLEADLERKILAGREPQDAEDAGDAKDAEAAPDQDRNKEGVRTMPPGNTIPDQVEELRKDFSEKNGADTFITQRYSARNLTFAYMHAYELINNTDDIEPEARYLRLAVLYVTFARYDSWFREHLRRWMRDFAVYYDLDPALAFEQKEASFEQQVQVLEKFEDRIRAEKPSGGRREQDGEQYSKQDGEQDGAIDGEQDGAIDGEQDGAIDGEQDGAIDSEQDGAIDDKRDGAEGGESVPAERQLTDEEIHAIFTAISNLSSRDPASSPFYRKYPEDVERAIVRSYAGICRFYLRNRRRLILETAFGGKENYPYYMFQSAIFYDRIPHDDYQYTAGPGRVYVCRNGKWTCERYLFAEKKNQFLGEIVHETERILRIRMNYGMRLKQKISSGALAEVIEQSVDAYLEDKKEAARPKVKINFEGLKEIRRAAAHTRDQLIVDEDAFVDPISIMNAPAAQKPEDGGAIRKPEDGGAIRKPEDGGAIREPEDGDAIREPEDGDAVAGSAGGAAGPLTAEQTAFLLLLMEGGDWKEFVRSHTDILSVSLLVDAINEALYDEIGDTVIELDGDTPVLIEDYREDLEELLGT